MKPKTMILMVVAVVCGLGASYMTSRLLAERDEQPAEPPPIPKVTLLVAKKKLDMHIPLGKKPEDFFVEKQFLAEDAQKDALTPSDLAKLKSKYLKRGLRQNDQVTPDDLMDGKGGLAALPAGMRAMGIQVNTAQIAGGFAASPGSHVDVMWTGREGGTGPTVTRLLLENIVVLAADTNDRAAEGVGAMVATVVTLALIPDDCQKLAQAMTTGALHLALRNFDDNTRTPAKEAPKEVVVQPPPKVEPPPPDTARKQTKPSVPEGVRKFTVTVINGDSVKQYHYWLDSNDNIVRVPELDPPDDPAPAPDQNDEKKKDDRKI